MGAPEPPHPPHRVDGVDEAEILAGIAAVGARLGVAGDIRPSARLIEDLALDSLQLLALAVEVENRFRIKIDPEAEAEIRTIGDLVAVVRRQLVERGAGGARGDG
ncbi:MAG TPA: acyl carrier protein [Thermoanaerobaculia bacterium]|nr:acyl carrier protein [Thermoanaerobaculia bacterium]